MSNRSRQVDNLISRLEAQHIQIDPTQAQLLLDATGGDLEMALALYWEDSVAHQAWERQQQQEQAQPGRDNAAKAKAANDADRPEKDNDSDSERDDNYARARRRVERRQADRRQRNRSKSALNKRVSRRSNNNDGSDGDAKDGDANDDLNEDDDIGMNNRRNNNRRDANRDSDNEGDDSDVESLRNHDMELDRDAQNRRRIIAANNRGDENNNNRPGNHVSVSDDETNFNEKFLQRIKNHMKKRKNAGDRYEARLKKKRRLFSWQDKFQRFASEVERSNRSGLGFEDAGAVFDELIKLSRLGETQRDDNYANGNMQPDDKHNEVDYKPIAKSIEDIDDDLSSDDEEENDLDAQYAEALNLLESTVVQPSSILWGGNAENKNSNDSSSQSNQGENDGENAQGEGSESRKPQEGLPDESGDRDGDGDDGDGDGDGDDDGNTTDAKGSEKKVEIPRTWLSASFNLSKCGTGLVLSKPDETEVARLKSIQNTIFPSGTSSIAPPLPPFHCGAITMLTSLVTALLYSDVSVQGAKIVANSLKRKPFIQLSAEERKKQFNERLADALAAILCIAAESSTKFRLETLSELLKKMKRKQESKKDPEMSDDECDRDQGLKDREITMRRVMETRAKLCPVCRWDNTNEEGVDVLDRDCLYMNVSLTNRQDLRAYVVSNIRSFTNPGGFALFLETILHIHGLPRVKRMLQELKERKPDDPLCCFVNCTCEKKLKEEWDDYMQKRMMNPSLRQKDWSLPLCRSCTGSELLSLLLTGKLHEDMSNWFAGTFSIGFLSGSTVENKNSVHERLKSPDQPIWIVEGKSSYFMLWNNDGKTQTKPLGDDSYSFKLNSWNCWTEDIKQEVLSIVPARNIVSDAPTSITEPITKTELERTLIHPDDEQNYSNYRRWRFAFNADQDTSNTPLNWMPFYKLNERQKEIVLRKSKSSVECAIWTKWPKAIVEASIVEN